MFSVSDAEGSRERTDQVGLERMESMLSVSGVDGGVLLRLRADL